jgi:hypothetical protein
MTRKEALAELWLATSGRIEESRMDAYERRLRPFGDQVVAHAVERLLRTWDRQGVPPIGMLVSRCRDVKGESMPQNGFSGDAPMRAMPPTEQEHCRVIAELFNAGLAWCEARGCWVPAGDEQYAEGTGQDAATPSLVQSRRALDAVRAGTLSGNAAIAEWRARSGVGKALQKMTQQTLEPPVPTSQQVALEDLGWATG